jgi:Na+/glutamate symporter
VTKEEVKAIKKKENNRITLGLLTLILGTIIVAVIIGRIVDVNSPWLLIALVPAFVGGGILISAPSIYQCERCGEYYQDKASHLEDVCLRILLSKLVQLIIVENDIKC